MWLSFWCPCKTNLNKLRTLETPPLASLVKGPAWSPQLANRIGRSKQRSFHRGLRKKGPILRPAFARQCDFAPVVRGSGFKSPSHQEKLPTWSAVTSFACSKRNACEHCHAHGPSDLGRCLIPWHPGQWSQGPRLCAEGTCEQAFVGRCFGLLAPFFFFFFFFLIA